MFGTSVRVGDRVKVVAYSNDTNGKIGFVEHINGGYIYVRLRWWPKGRQIEVYDSEIIKYPKGE